MWSSATRFRRIATLVAKSGGRMSATRPGLEPLAEPLLDAGELARQAVAGEHQLPAGLVQRVEGVEELLLGLGLAGQELHVVDQQHVGVAIGVLEAVERASVSAVMKWFVNASTVV